MWAPNSKCPHSTYCFIFVLEKSRRSGAFSTDLYAREWQILEMNGSEKYFWDWEVCDRINIKNIKPDVILLVQLTSVVIWRYFDDAGGQEIGQQVVNVLLTEAFLWGRNLWEFDDAGGQKFEQQVVNVHLRGFGDMSSQLQMGSSILPQWYSWRWRSLLWCLASTGFGHWAGRLDGPPFTWRPEMTEPLQSIWDDWLV